jgi:hypothetical protein
MVCSPPRVPNSFSRNYCWAHYYKKIIMYSKSYRESSTSYFLVHFQKATTYKDTWCPSFIWEYKQDVKFHIASYLVQNHKMLFYCFQVYIYFIIIPSYVVENHKMNKHQQRTQRHITVMCRSRH